MDAALVPHSRPMLPAEAAPDEEALVAFFRRFPGERFTLASHWDGVACSLEYRRGRLERALTRGDGLRGEDITKTVFEIQYVPKLIGDFADLSVRGDLLVSSLTMEEMNREAAERGGKPTASLRRLAEETIRLGDLAEVRRRMVEFRPWEALGPMASGSARERLEALRNFGFRAPEDTAVEDEEGLRASLRKRMWHLARLPQDLPVSGVALRLDSVEARERLGSGWQVWLRCPVFGERPAGPGETTVLSVEWRTGRTGRLTPVATVAPVEAGGRVVERIPLDSLSRIRSLGVKIGSRVRIAAPGGAAARIAEVLDEGEDGDGDAVRYSPDMGADMDAEGGR